MPKKMTMVCWFDVGLASTGSRWLAILRDQSRNPTYVSERDKAGERDKKPVLTHVCTSEVTACQYSTHTF